jgi:hypothetical protein
MKIKDFYPGNFLRLLFNTVIGLYKESALWGPTTEKDCVFCNLRAGAEETVEHWASNIIDFKGRVSMFKGYWL